MGFFVRIGISGKMGSGKSTLARMIALSCGTIQNIVVASFATGVRDVVRAALRASPKNLDKTAIVDPGNLRPITNDKLKSRVPQSRLDFINGEIERRVSIKPCTVGRMLQIVGTLFREWDPDYWVNVADANYGSNRVVVYDDVRFPNEAKYVQTVGSKFSSRLIYLKRDDSCDATGRDPQHVSETSITPEIIRDYNFLVLENWDLDKKEQFVDDVIRPFILYNSVG